MNASNKKAKTPGYTNPRKAVSDHCRGVTKRYPIAETIGRTQGTILVTD